LVAHSFKNVKTFPAPNLFVTLPQFFSARTKVYEATTSLYARPKLSVARPTFLTGFSSLRKLVMVFFSSFPPLEEVRNPAGFFTLNETILFS